LQLAKWNKFSLILAITQTELTQYILKFLSKYYLSFLVAIIILVLSLIPINTSVGSGLLDFPHADKVAHFMLYGLLSFILLHELHRNFKGKISIILFTLILCLSYGGMIEIFQSFIDGRSSEAYDLLADFIGSIMAIPAFYLFKRLFGGLYA